MTGYPLLGPGTVVVLAGPDVPYRVGSLETSNADAVLHLTTVDGRPWVDDRVRDDTLRPVLPPELEGTPWDTPSGRSMYARIAADPPAPEQLREPEPWQGQALDLCRRQVLDAVEGVDRIAAALADAYAAGLDAGERRG